MNVIESYIADGINADTSIDVKTKHLFMLFEAAISLTETAKFAAWDSKAPLSKPSRLFFTVAGYENGVLKVQQSELIPRRMDGVFDSSVTQNIESNLPCSSTFSVDQTFHCTLAGLTQVGNDILAGRDYESTSNAAVSRYLSARKGKKDGELPLEDLVNLAIYIKERTASRFHNVEVGGSTEMATFADGRLTFVEPVGDLPIESADVITRFHYQSHILIVKGKFGINDEPTRGGLRSSPIIASIVFDSSFTFVVQPLDNMILSHNYLKDCVLTYSGAKTSLLDKSNVLDNCRLVLQSPELDTTPFVRAFKRDFPNVRISHGSLSPRVWATGI